MKFSAWYSILVGILMVAQWSFFLAVGAVPELDTEPIALVFHLAAEFATAVCMIGGCLAACAWQKPAIFAARCSPHHRAQVTLLVGRGYS
jgi:hypothetical protein